MLCSILGLWCPQIDAFYYPNRADLTIHEAFLDVGSVEQCRSVVYDRANQNNDPNMIVGDYECGIDPHDTFGTITVYRETVK